MNYHFSPKPLFLILLELIFGKPVFGSPKNGYINANDHCNDHFYIKTIETGSDVVAEQRSKEMGCFTQCLSNTTLRQPIHQIFGSSNL